MGWIDSATPITRYRLPDTNSTNLILLHDHLKLPHTNLGTCRPASHKDEAHRLALPDFLECIRKQHHDSEHTPGRVLGEIGWSQQTQAAIAKCGACSASVAIGRDLLCGRNNGSCLMDTERRS